MSVQPKPNFNVLTGKSYERDAFQFIDTDNFDAQIVLDVLQGRRAGVIFRKQISDDECKTIKENFWKSEMRYTRGEAVPAQYLGTYHYAKKIEKYFEQAEAVNPSLDMLFENTNDPVERFGNAVAALAYEQKIQYRQAEHDGHKSCRFVMRSWSESGAFSLKPHEDWSQCLDPAQADFEAQKMGTNPLMATNMNVEAAEGGFLRYFNIIPDEVSKAELGLTHVGYPYPIESLEGIEYQDIYPRQGDIYCFNAAAVHAVGPITSVGQQRATIAFVSGMKDEKTILTWT
ncbi:MAG: hypothetical protein ACPGVN_00350 [Alphaproteobacteria bacterium]